MDCIGLLAAALFGAGWVPKHPDAVAQLDYDRLSTRDEVLEVLRGEAREVEAKPALFLPGDVVTFRFSGHAWTQHLGLISGISGGVPTLLHARATGERKTSCVVEHDLADGWLEALDAAFRLEDVLDDITPSSATPFGVTPFGATPSEVIRLG